MVLVLYPTKDTTVAEYDEYDREICSALADLIDTTCDFLPESYAVWYDENDNEHHDFTLEDPNNHENAYCSKCGGIMMVGEDGEDGWFTRKKAAHGNKLIPNFDYYAVRCFAYALDKCTFYHLPFTFRNH